MIDLLGCKLRQGNSIGKTILGLSVGIYTCFLSRIWGQSFCQGLGRIFILLPCRSSMLHSIYSWQLKKLREASIFPWWKISLFSHPESESKCPSYICKTYRKICFSVLLEFKRPEHSACSRLSLILHASDRKNFQKISPPSPFFLPFPLVFYLFFSFYFSFLWYLWF